MNCSTRSRSLLWMLAIVAVGMAFSPGSADAEEPGRQFLEALRGEGLYDLANEYLQQMEKSPLASPEFRETVLFEQGLTLMAMSRSETSFERRQQRLDEAQKKFREFLTAQKNHDYAPKAKSELANVLVERARVKMAEVDRAKNAADKPALLKEAGQFYDQAHKEFVGSQEEIKKKIESLPKQLDPVRDKARIAYRDELRADYVKVRMVQATILHEKSKTATSDKEKMEILKQAAATYGDLYNDYRRRLAGLYALLQQGACYQEMGGEKNLTEALTFYQELLEQPYEEKPLRDLRTKTLVQTLQCWIHPDIKDKKLDPAIDTASKWLTQMRPDESGNEDWLNLCLETARAYKLRIATFNENDPKRAVDLKAAKMLVEHGLKNSSGTLKDKFIELNAELGGKIEKKPDEKPDPKTFAEAYDAGKATFDTITKEHMPTRDALEKNLKAAKDAAAKAGVQKQLDDLQKTMVKSRFEAIEYFRKALAMMDTTVDLDEVNNVRYYLCSLHFTERNYYDAAGYGTFLARYFSNHAAAKYCAIIARASYLNLYNQAPEEDRDFEADRVVEICKLTLEKWPDDEAADDTLITLVKFMVRQKNLDEAKRYLAMVKPDSPRRGEAEIATGQAMWSTYLSGMQPVRQWEMEVQQWKSWAAGEKPPPEDVDVDGLKSKIAAQETQIATRKAELAPLKEEAQQTLKNGIERMRQKEIDATLATAVLSLCQVYVDGEQADDAIKLLEDDKIGALTLVKNKNEAVMREGVPQEAYKTALRAYIGALPGATNKQSMIAKAEAAMDGLKGTVTQDAAGQEKLIGIYVTLAGDVKKQIDIASPVNRKPLTQGFATFLDKVAGTSNEFTVLNWVAENYYQLGEANDTGQGEPTDEAKAFFNKAASQYEKLIDKAKGDSSISANAVVQMRLRLANVLRRQGKFVLAMDQMEEVLKDPKRNSMLNVQVDAAQTYMEWAQSEVGVPKLYLVAVSGGRRNKADKPNIWGWSQIAQRLANQIELHGETMDEASVQKFTDTMHQAKHHKAECYYQYALVIDDADKKKMFLEGALENVRQTVRSYYPGLGGPKWSKEYDDLVKKIQTELETEAKGLEAFTEGLEELASADGAPPSDGGGGE